MAMEPAENQQNAQHFTVIRLGTEREHSGIIVANIVTRIIKPNDNMQGQILYKVVLRVPSF